ncbi:MAG: amidohydrolase family protein [Candidatus Goldbacteria bacterium]|nr:amidohydrolase family protein [Candidatus Goldiibacteriota bacterium]
MLIDFHTHFYPEDIAQNTVKKLSQLAGFKFYGEGTIDSLKQFMEMDGVDISINAPVATKPEQVKSINRKMIDINKNEKNIICLGAMHPLFGKNDNVEEEIDFIVKNGIKGIKMHPEYQSFYPDDGGMKVIYDACIKNDIFILFHAGADAAFDFDDAKGTPKRFRQVIKSYPKLKIILAHMGGYQMWDMVYKELVGLNVYFDTAFCNEMDDNIMANLIKEHGCDKIVFGTDFPWERVSVLSNKIKKLINDTESKNKIFCLNAKKLLNIE